MLRKVGNLSVLHALIVLASASVGLVAHSFTGFGQIRCGVRSVLLELRDFFVEELDLGSPGQPERLGVPLERKLIELEY